MFLDLLLYLWRMCDVELSCCISILYGQDRLITSSWSSMFENLKHIMLVKVVMVTKIQIRMVETRSRRFTSLPYYGYYLYPCDWDVPLMGWMSWHDVFSSDVCVDQYHVIVGDHNTRPMGMGQHLDRLMWSYKRCNW